MTDDRATAVPQPETGTADSEPATASLRRDQPLVPAGSISGRALVTVIAILTFLAALTACGAVLMARASSDWRADVAREMTIQVRPTSQRDVEADVAKAADIAKATPGIASAEIYSKAEAERLLEPWLGSNLGLAELPIPRIVVLKLANGRQLDPDGLRKALAAAVPGSTLDDHHMWITRLAAMANTVVVIGALIVGLVLVATALAVAFATRGAMAGNKEIVEVLHFVGADDRFIAREFQARFLNLGLRGGLIGGLGAVALIMLLGMLAAVWRSSAGGEQIEALFGAFSIGWEGYAAVLAIAIVVALVTAVMSRVTVRRHLHDIE
ncbi:cell division protein FtsX [Chelatococcus reniformis]|uniref:Cell division protein FtsX n=1 Tax=Chelatococcus reniformis TaxID=1494448 RepID=A0A916UXB1_9HYPH|nr:cell division protein FtsX [Chelatococcus reniformis]